jgi:NAD(P)-dependent dehydrogenase (short-subunit alcohol dehydrogenase family)
MKTILITGGSGKIGFQLVRHFLNNGFFVVTTMRKSSSFLEKIKAACNIDFLANLRAIEVDFTTKGAEEKIIDELAENGLRISDLVHNARCIDFLKIEVDHSVSEKNFLGEFHMDVVFPYRLTLGILKQNPHLANVLFVSSMYGVVAPTPSLYDDFHASSPVNYGVSKAAQIHLTKELAVRLAPKTRVNCISFGGVKGRTNAAFDQKYRSLNPMQMMMEEEDVVGPVDFMVSDKSSQMTGQNIIVDGGWTIW